MAPLASFVAALAALASAASAAAIARQGPTLGFQLRANTSTGAPINANGGFFWLGRPTNFDCPGKDCSSFTNTTSIVVSNGGATMFAAVPGGQTIYVDKTGALRYTPAGHASADPPGSIAHGFSLVKDGKFSEFLELEGTPNDGFVTCGDDGQVFAIAGSLSCPTQVTRVLPVGVATEQTGAFEYQ